jgi:hypothetical protein
LAARLQGWAAPHLEQLLRDAESLLHRGEQNIAHQREVIGRWWLPGQWIAGGENPTWCDFEP